MKYLCLSLIFAACQSELPIVPGSGSALIVVCGDGVIGPGEACDDGNQSDFDACTKICTNATCGDGITRRDITDPLDTGYEACDDGNDRDDDSCTNRCKSPVCGDGRQLVGVEPGEAGYEQCDDGNRVASDGCTNDCLAARCGDGVIRSSAEDDADLEECDDGNAVDTDGCRNNCQIASCGDGVQRFDIASGESNSCDENSDCEGGLCIGKRCYFGGFEGCDDGNDDNDDGCLNGCVNARCGDGVIRSDTVEGDEDYELCDDGNDDDSDACNGQCQPAFCGDGVKRTDLDDLRRDPAPCVQTSDCQDEETCTGRRCEPVGFESCDDGNRNNNDACHTLCSLPGSTPASAAPSCQNLYNQGFRNSKLYWLDLDGAGELEPIKLYCDQDTTGGGWIVLVGEEGIDNRLCDWIDISNDSIQAGDHDGFAERTRCNSLLYSYESGSLWNALRFELTAPVDFRSMRSQIRYAAGLVQDSQGYEPSLSRRSLPANIYWAAISGSDFVWQGAFTDREQAIDPFDFSDPSVGWGIIGDGQGQLQFRISYLAIR